MGVSFGNCDDGFVKCRWNLLSQWKCMKYHMVKWLVISSTTLDLVVSFKKHTRKNSVFFKLLNFRAKLRWNHVSHHRIVMLFSTWTMAEAPKARPCFLVKLGGICWRWYLEDGLPVDCSAWFIAMDHGYIVSPLRIGLRDPFLEWPLLVVNGDY